LSPPGTPRPDLCLRPEDIPNLDQFVIEDGKPVDGIVSEKQMRLLTEPLYSSWSGPSGGRPFVAMANVGVFHTVHEPPIVPDVLFAEGVRQGSDITKKENLSYFVWLRGKVPDVAIEIVSNREGGEDTSKLEIYARIRVLYYVIFDPENDLCGGVLRVFVLREGEYVPLSGPWFFEKIGLGLRLWQGRFEDLELNWLRWCDREGKVIPTGAELAAQERQRAEQERQRADAALRQVEELKAQLRARGAALSS
jgi:hypothetical protein